MKSLSLLSLLVFFTACVPLGNSTVDTPKPTSTSSLTTTAISTLLLPTPTPIFDVVIDNVAVNQTGQLYANGFGTLGDDVRHYAQWDGTKWIALGNGFQTAGNVLAVDSAGYLYTETLTNTEQGMATAIMRWDGDKWEDITGNFSPVVDNLQAGRISSNIPVLAFAVDREDNLYAAGSFYYPSVDHTTELPMGYVAKWNQDNWTVVGQGFDQVNIYALAVSPTGEVYVSGEQPRSDAAESTNNGFIALWDGKKWREIDTSQLNYCLNIKNVALDETRGVYASCSGSEAGDLIFYWGGTDWITITDQLKGEAPAVYDMALDKNGQLCIGGSFESVGDIPAQNIACWDGIAWHSLGEGINERAYALVFGPGGELYAVGFFTKAGNLPTHHAALWDGKTWHGLEP